MLLTVYTIMSVLPLKQCRCAPTLTARVPLCRDGLGGLGCRSKSASGRLALLLGGRRSRGLRALLAMLLPVVLAGCGLFTSLPEPSTTVQRLDVLSSMPQPAFEGPVTIYWDEHMVPFISAESDIDAALALGLVHAHLRLGQMEVFKRAAGGRLSELLSKFGTPYDEAIRAVNFYRVVDDIIATMPPTTLEWLTAYVAGINHYKTHIGELPHDMIIGSMENEPWSIRDTLAIGKLISADINWMTMGALLKLREEDNWAQLFGQLMSHSEGLQPTSPASLPEMSFYPGTGEMFTNAPAGLGSTGSFGATRNSNNASSLGNAGAPVSSGASIGTRDSNGTGSNAEGGYSSFKGSDGLGGAGDTGEAGGVGGLWRCGWPCGRGLR